MKKPQYLYHGSSVKDLKIVKPRRISFRDQYEGKLVFATPYRTFASCFIVNTDDSWVKISRFSDNPNKFCAQTIIIISDKRRFLANDKGGAIYTLPSDTFSTKSKKGAGFSEWTSAERVIPIKSVSYKSGLEAMIENRVQVYFVDSYIFKQIEESKNNGRSIIQTLKPEV